jgi:cytochrome P450
VVFVDADGAGKIDDLSRLVSREKINNSPWQALASYVLLLTYITLQTAGSDTSYSASVHAFYYLAKNPAMQQRLREEVFEAVTSEAVPNWTKLSTLPLLDGIINETLRLHPPVPSGMGRETPKGGAQIGPYWVSGETIVAIPTYTIQRDERYFAKPNEWIPERWFSQSELIIDRHAWIPFSVGPMNCAGKYFAVMEMKVLIAKAVASFDIQMAPGEDGKDMMENCKDYMTLWLPTLMLCLVPREKS